MLCTKILRLRAAEHKVLVCLLFLLFKLIKIILDLGQSFRGLGPGNPGYHIWRNHHYRNSRG